MPRRWASRPRALPEPSPGLSLPCVAPQPPPPPSQLRSDSISVEGAHRAQGSTRCWWGVGVVLGFYPILAKASWSQGRGVRPNL